MRKICFMVVVLALVSGAAAIGQDGMTGVGMPLPNLCPAELVFAQELPAKPRAAVYNRHVMIVDQREITHYQVTSYNYKNELLGDRFSECAETTPLPDGSQWARIVYFTKTNTGSHLALDRETIHSPHNCYGADKGPCKHGLLVPCRMARPAQFGQLPDYPDIKYAKIGEDGRLDITDFGKDDLLLIAAFDSHNNPLLVRYESKQTKRALPPGTDQLFVIGSHVFMDIEKINFGWQRLDLPAPR